MNEAPRVWLCGDLHLENFGSFKADNRLVHFDINKTWAAEQANPKFFRLLDVARRIAGTGSLGIDRYVALIEGAGSPNDNYLLDLKEARHSALRRWS